MIVACDSDWAIERFTDYCLGRLNDRNSERVSGIIFERDLVELFTEFEIQLGVDYLRGFLVDAAKADFEKMYVNEDTAVEPRRGAYLIAKERAAAILGERLLGISAVQAVPENPCMRPIRWVAKNVLHLRS